ncbi:hypothetical protein MKK64_03825 [Methylobacterium sp. E-025]|uniref:hypothetical protein n=1 Tax=Methylobacterium sp. E-025 TaxID=2836561 RepID=UPI001FBA24FD|nr:hypothetical protein [Methylobacterium sp. E-025]MCJ2110338.1 hypothetical protein [Methylobacterium sp. E-025]
MLSVLSHSLKAGFRPDQPRGQDGRWTGGAGQIVRSQIEKTGNARIDAKTELLVDVVKEAISISGDVRVPAYGVRLHAATARLIRNLDIPGIGRHGVEQSFSLGDSVGYGLEGSVRTDVVLRDGRTSSAPILAVWDFKTGNARLTPARVREIREGLGVGSDVPVIEIHVRRGVAVKSHAATTKISVFADIHWF